VTVHIGARVSARAAAGELPATSMVRDVVAGSGNTFVDRGEVELKGIPWSVAAHVRPALTARQLRVSLQG
jgi:class 3 adenylate cyclase